MKGVVIGSIMCVCGIYLLNPGFGFFELIPDNVPFVGNLDEAGAMTLLLTCLRYFGLDVTKLFQKNHAGVIEI